MTNCSPKEAWAIFNTPGGHEGAPFPGTLAALNFIALVSEVNLGCHGATLPILHSSRVFRGSMRLLRLGVGSQETEVRSQGRAQKYRQSKN